MSTTTVAPINERHTQSIPIQNPAFIGAFAAALITLAVALPSLSVALVSFETAKFFITATVLLTSMWIAADAVRLDASEYKSAVSCHPLVLFTASLGLWFAIFPVYLTVRSKILTGQLQKTGPAKAPSVSFYVCLSLWAAAIALITLTYIKTTNNLNGF